MTAIDAFAALRNPNLRALIVARCAAAMGQQIINVTVGWQLYDITGSAWSLGLLGVFELAPVLFFSIPAGNAADRYPRRNLAMLGQLIMALAATGLMLTSWFRTSEWFVYTMLFVVGTARIFYSTSVWSLLPQLVPKEQFANANAWASSSFQTASILGPAFGGAIIAWTGTATWAYIAALCGNLIFILAATRLPVIKPTAAHHKRSVSDLFAGFHFIRRTPVFLAAITLDMFAVLLGGAVVLLPIFAKDILHVGPEGLGWLRAAPSFGSICMLMMLTRIRPWARPGIALLVAVAGFGLATIAFGLSRNFALSMFCLALTGAFDSVSVVIRSTLEQVVTPDHLRGRVGAISYVFIGFSNEFGAFESGTTAALFGTIASVVGGGIGTIVVVLAVAALWPVLVRIGPLHTLKPTEIEEASAETEIRHAV